LLVGSHQHFRTNQYPFHQFHKSDQRRQDFQLFFQLFFR